MDELLQDLTFSARLLRKSLVFTVISVLTLALGIGASTTIFSVIDAIWLQPLRFPTEERLVMVWESAPKQGVDRTETSLGSLGEWKQQGGVFEHLAGIVAEPMYLGGQEQPERLQGFRVGGSLFPALSAKVALGRTFLEEEERPGNEAVVVLGHALWQRRFGADPGVVGRTVTLGGRPHTVVGVMAPGFEFPPTAELWLPLAPGAEAQQDFGNRQVRVVGRLKEGMGVEQASAAMRVLAQRMETEHPATHEARSIRLTSIREAYLGSSRPVLLMLMGAVGFVLLIACANVANLLLARAATRQHEMSIRAALGARRVRLIRQLLTESVVLAVLGGVLGVVLAVWGTDLLASALPSSVTQRVPGWQDIHVDGRVLAFSLGLSVVTGLLFGLAPAFRGSRFALASALKDGGRATDGRSRMRSALVVAEVALALMLLVGAGLMLRSFHQIQATSPGFTSEDVLAFELALTDTEAPAGAAPELLFQQLLERLSAHPGVTSAAAISLLPMSRGNQSSHFSVVGQPPLSSSEQPQANQRVITPGYFSTMKIPLLQGRELTAADSGSAPRVALVNAEMARRYWPGQQALGQRFQLGTSEPWEIIGVVGDVRSIQRSHLRRAVPEFYLPLAQAPRTTLSVVLRTSGEPLALAAAIRGEVARFGNGFVPPSPRPLEQVVAETMGPRRLLAQLLGVFAGLALLLASGGIYGVMAYSVSQRTREFGVRMALGADERRIFWLVLGQALRLVGLGVALGALAAAALMRLMAALLFETSPSDPSTFLATAALLMLVALLASYLPARRATRLPLALSLKAD